MTEEIKPALTPDWWERIPDGGVEPKPLGNDWMALDGWPVKLTRHALAALCLYGKPFGFTPEDVELLRNAALDADASDYRGADAAAFDDLAARIAALLPPSR